VDFELFLCYVVGVICLIGCLVLWLSCWIVDGCLIDVCLYFDDLV